MAPALFWSIKFERRVKKWPEPKKLLKQKINFFISINYAKEFLNSLHTGVVFSELFSRASNGRHYSRSRNFQLKISLCSVFQHTEFKFQGCSWIWKIGFVLVHASVLSNRACQQWMLQIRILSCPCAIQIMPVYLTGQSQAFRDAKLLLNWPFAPR